MTAVPFEQQSPGREEDRAQKGDTLAPPMTGPRAVARPLRAEQTVPAPQGWSEFTQNQGLSQSQQPRRSRFRLQREDEVPRLLAAQGIPDTVSARSSTTSDGHRPVQLASEREERRQVLAICRVVCQATVETLKGLRPAGQMQRWLEAEVYRKVLQRAQIMGRARSESATPAGAVQPQRLRFHSERTTHARAGAWEVCLVFSDDQRVRACALRLQAHRRRWRVVAMELG